MRWLDRDGSSVCAPYRVVRGVRGFSAYVYSKERSGLLGQGMGTVKEAKELCEKDKAKQEQTA